MRGLHSCLSKQPEALEHVAPIEKALIDLKVESQKLQLLDESEVQRIIDTALGAGLLQLSVLMGYSEAKRENIGSAEITH